MTVNRLLRELLNVKGASVAGFDLREHEGGAKTLVVHVRLYKRDKWRCPVCGRKCPVHDYVCGEAFWRGMDFGPVRVVVGSRVPRVCCPGHGVLTAGVPWAKPSSRFTLDFARSAAWMVKCGLSRSRVAERLGIDWKTVGRLVALVWHDLEPDVRKRFDGLKKIGIDETSYKKGHSYITTVVNHETNTVIWVCEGHGKEAVDKFFKELTPEQRASIEVVTGDGARWITDSCAEHCPGAKRCLDPFHAVEWANAALDAVRVEAWRRALEKWRGMGKPKNGDKEAKEARRGRHQALEIRARQEPGEPHSRPAGTARRDPGRRRRAEPRPRHEGAAAAHLQDDRRGRGGGGHRQVDRTRAKMPHPRVRRAAAQDKAPPRAHHQCNPLSRQQRQD